MLADQLDQVVRSGVRLVMITVVVVAIFVMLVMMKRHFISGSRNVVVVMNLSEEMVANVACLEHEQQRHQHSHPPASRSWLDGASA